MTAIRIDALFNVGEARSLTGLVINTIIDRTAEATRTVAQALDSICSGWRNALQALEQRRRRRCS
jgi:hypothetical protein